MRIALITFCTLALAACRPDGPQVDADRFELENTADSVAFRILAYHGGPAAWDAVRFLRFDFGFEGGGESRTTARHLWDRETGDYRVEWPSEAGSYVVLFNVDAVDDGRVFLNEEEVAEGAEDLRARAFQRYINDTYWLLSATKLFDDGVFRYHEPDSSLGPYDVIRIEFEGVGLTPGDRYWYWADRETGAVARWAYVLQGNPEATPTVFEWRDYREFAAGDARVRLAARKQAQGADRAIVFPSLDLPSDLDRAVFFDPTVTL